MEEERPPALESKDGERERSREGEKDLSKAQPVHPKKVMVDTSNLPENQPVKYGMMGSEDIPIDKEADTLFFTSLRIGEIKGLEGCFKCKVECFKPGAKL